MFGWIRQVNVKLCQLQTEHKSESEKGFNFNWKLSSCRAAPVWPWWQLVPHPLHNPDPHLCVECLMSLHFHCLFSVGWVRRLADAHHNAAEHWGQHHRKCSRKHGHSCHTWRDNNGSSPHPTSDQNHWRRPGFISGQLGWRYRPAFLAAQSTILSVFKWDTCEKMIYWILLVFVQT